MEYTIKEVTKKYNLSQHLDIMKKKDYYLNKKESKQSKSL